VTSRAATGAGNRPLLLDTCAIIFLARGAPMAHEANDGMLIAGRGGGLLVSLVSTWEIGLLGRPGRRTLAAELRPDPQTWFDRVMARPGFLLAPFTPAIAIGASSLPGDLHEDPADRLLVTTARHLGVPLVTRDARLIAYARAGHLAVLPC
jgi:PIN domain nuclease of toxin-antitoxin system